MISYKEDPKPQVTKEQIFVERRYYTPLEVDLGFSKIVLGNDGTDGISKFFGLSFGLDFESLFSSSHRKKHGLSGSRNAKAVANSLKIKYDGLLKSYVNRGWLELSN